MVEIKDLEKDSKKLSFWYQKEIKDLENKITSIGKILGKENTQFNEPPKFSPKHIQFKPQIQRTREVAQVPHESKPVLPSFPAEEGEYNLNLCERKLYSLFFQYSDRTFTKPQVGVFTGYSHKSGGFNNSLSRLRQLGLIEGSGNSLKIKEINPELSQEFDFSKEAIINKLSKCEKEIYSVLLQNPYETFGKEELAQTTQTQYSHNSGGFNNAIARLNTLGIIQRTDGMIKINPELLEI